MDDKEFYLKDYELKIQYLNSHFNRMWQRFNFFLVVEMGLSAAIWTLSNKCQDSKYVSVVIVVGFLSSICWYVFGAQDRFLVEAYRTAVEDSGSKISEKLGIEKYDFVGKINVGVEKSFIQWRIKEISITKLASIFPILMVIYWLVLLTWYILTISTGSSI